MCSLCPFHVFLGFRPRLCVVISSATCLDPGIIDLMCSSRQRPTLSILYASLSDFAPIIFSLKTETARLSEMDVPQALRDEQCHHNWGQQELELC